MRSRKSSVPEREVHVRLWEIFKNVIYREEFEFENTQFVDIRVEPTINGRPDLVIEAVEKGRARRIPLLVIETKRKVPYRDPRFDPYSKDVIKQAVTYANQMGAPYFATCNGDIMVVFKTFTPGVPLIQRRLKQYKVFWEEEFARIVLKELVRFKLGVGRWLPLDDIFVERLRSFHRFITPFMYEALSKKVKEDEKFEKQYVNWLKSQMFEYSEKVNETIAEQMAYLLMNKIAFYKTLESQIVNVDIKKLEKIEAKNGAEYSQKLQEKFRRLTKIADYEGVFSPTVLDKVPLPDKLVYHLNEFIEELDAYSLGRIQSDVLGRVYEDLIPSGERHRLGQYYTPSPIVDLIVKMCVKSPNDKVLDPACGSGSFLVKAYHELQDLKKKENPFRSNDDLHRELLEQTYGIDINPFPAQLSSINLAIRNLKVRSEHINLLPMDFFKVKPRTAPLPKQFDVVVTNPPYTRQEEMEYKEQIREEALTYSDGSKIQLDARAGIYTYFFTHSAKFLKNNGMMGQITSDTWLDVGFGEDLKRFFLNHFKIHAIIWYDVRAFERALVGTCITILEKEDKSEIARENNIVRFTTIKKPMPIEEIVRMIETTKEDFDDENIGITIKIQRELEPETKWGVILRAPKIYNKIVNHRKVTKLGEIASIRRGITSGANQFFYLDEDKIDLWSIEKEYLKPIVTSPREMKIEISPHDISQWVLVVKKSKEQLAREKANVLEYIQWGEETETRIRGGRRGGTIVKGFHNLSTVKSRKLWYDIGDREPAPILRSRRIWERCLYLVNKAKALANDSLYEVRPINEKYVTVLAGILNSSIIALVSELEGRFYGAGVLELEVYETKSMTVVDPRKLSSKEHDRIETAFSKICEAQNVGDSKLEQEAQRELDNVVFDVLELKKKERKQVYESLASLRGMRLQRKEVEVLVETAENWKPRKKPKRKRQIRMDSSKRLDAWIKREDQL